MRELFYFLKSSTGASEREGLSSCASECRDVLDEDAVVMMNKSLSMDFLRSAL